MLAVGRYIQQGVYTVAGPFHPFGGAVDIVVVKQEDGTFKSSPWYVKFGKFQGVLKRREKWVDVAVNDVTVPFHMYLDATGEAYFLKDTEPDSEDTVFSPPSALSSGDEASVEPLAIEAAPAEAGSEIKPYDAAGEENFDSTDERPADLEMRYGARKASLLLVQEGQVSEGVVVSGTELDVLPEHELLSDPAPTALNTDPSITSSNGQLAADGNNEMEIANQSSESLALGSKLTVVNGVTVPRVPIEDGAAVRALLNRVAGLNKSDHAGPVGSLIANAALTSLAKAATTPGDGLSASLPTKVDELPSSLEYLEAVTKDDVGSRAVKSTKPSSSSTTPLRSLHLIRDITTSGLQGSNSLDSRLMEDFAMVKLELLRSKSDLSSNRCSALKRANSDIGVYHGCSDSSDVSSLTIASADGIIFLETPPPEVSGVPSSSDSQADAEAAHVVPILQRVEEEELPDNSVLTSMSELCRQEFLETQRGGPKGSGVKDSNREQNADGDDGAAKHETAHDLAPVENSEFFVSISKDEEECVQNGRIRLDEERVADSVVSSDASGAHGHAGGVGAEAENNFLHGTGGSTDVVCELHKESGDNLVVPKELSDKVVKKNGSPRTGMATSQSECPASSTGFVEGNLSLVEGSPVFELQESVMEKGQRVLDMQEDQETPEKRLRTSEQAEGDKESREVVEDRLVVAPLLEGSSIAIDDVDPSSCRTAIAEQEMAWREAIGKAAAALKFAPPSIRSPHGTRFPDRKVKPDSLNSSPKRSEPQESPQNSTSPAVLDRKSSPSSSLHRNPITSEQGERRSWGWWGWRGGPTPPKVMSSQDTQKQLKDLKAAASEVEGGKADGEKGSLLTKAQDTEEPSISIPSGQDFGDSVGKVRSISRLESDRHESGSVYTGASNVDSLPIAVRSSMPSRSKWRQDAVWDNPTNSSRSTGSRKEQDEETSDTASSKERQKTQGRKADMTRRRSILGIVFRGREALSDGADDGQAMSAKRNALDRETSLERAEIVSDLLENSWGYGRVKGGWGPPKPTMSVATESPSGIPGNKKLSTPELEESSRLEVTDATERAGDNDGHSIHEEVHADTMTHPSQVSTSGVEGDGVGSSQASGGVGVDSVASKPQLEESVGGGGALYDVLQCRSSLFERSASSCDTDLSDNRLAGENPLEDVTNDKTELGLENNKLQEESRDSKREADVNDIITCTTSGQEKTDPLSEDHVAVARMSSSGSSHEEGSSNSNVLSVVCSGQDEVASPTQCKKGVKFATSIDRISPRVCFVEMLPLDESVTFVDQPLTKPAEAHVKSVLETQKFVPVNDGGPVSLALTKSVNNPESPHGYREDTQDVADDAPHKTGVEDSVDSVSESRCSEESVQVQLANGSMSSWPGVSDITLQPASPLAVESCLSTSSPGKAVTAVGVTPSGTDVINLVMTEAGEAVAEPSTQQAQEESEDEHGNPYDDVVGTSKRSIYYDANTSDDEGPENVLGANDEVPLLRNKSDPINIPAAAALETDASNDSFMAARDRPLSESLPEVRFQYVDAESEQKAVSRSLGSDPLPLIRTISAGPEKPESFAQSLGNDGPKIRGFKEPGSEEVVGSPLGSTRSGDVSAGEEGVASDDGEERAVETGIELSLCRHLLKDQMGNEEAAKAFESTKVSFEEFRNGGTTIMANDKLVVRVGGKYFAWNVAAPIVLGILAFGKFVLPEKKGAIPVERPEPPPETKAPPVGALIPTASGGWKLWPFPLRRARTLNQNIAVNPAVSREALLAATATAVASPFVNDLLSENGYYQRPRKNKVRTIIPSSEMLAQLNLKEGSNVITFTFFTRMLGRQQVDARIYLWKWNTRIVISDVDGTITKSDLLGQVMPLVGKDWTQSGVARLFSAIKDNGYELLFLSARAISQAYLTRQFLFNVKQDGDTLPAGPVVISPDGLFPSLYREVIRRAPHEFKIACLQDIRSLFPEDCNPFYAGFGNRDTDEISYLKVGIPKGKIFIINPKGEVAVNNRPDVRTYTSLHKMVNDMFPAQTHNEQEDFNSWNYWKMPIIDIDDELKSASALSSKRS